MGKTYKANSASNILIINNSNNDELGFMEANGTYGVPFEGLDAENEGLYAETDMSFGFGAVTTEPLNLFIKHKNIKRYERSNETVANQMKRKLGLNDDNISSLGWEDKQFPSTLSSVIDGTHSGFDKTGLDTFINRLVQAGLAVEKEILPVPPRRQSLTSNPLEESVYLNPSTAMPCFTLEGDYTYSDEKIKQMLLDNKLEFMPLDQETSDTEFYAQLFNFDGSTVESEDTEGMYDNDTSLDSTDVIQKRKPSYIATIVPASDPMLNLNASNQTNQNDAEDEETFEGFGGDDNDNVYALASSGNPVKGEDKPHSSSFTRGSFRLSTVKPKGRSFQAIDLGQGSPGFLVESDALYAELQQSAGLESAGLVPAHNYSEIDESQVTDPNTHYKVTFAKPAEINSDQWTAIMGALNGLATHSPMKKSDKADDAGLIYLLEKNNKTDDKPAGWGAWVCAHWRVLASVSAIVLVATATGVALASGNGSDPKASLQSSLQAVNGSSISPTFAPTMSSPFVLTSSVDPDTQPTLSSFTASPPSKSDDKSDAPSKAKTEAPSKSDAKTGAPSKSNAKTASPHVSPTSMPTLVPSHATLKVDIDCKNPNVDEGSKITLDSVFEATIENAQSIDGKIAAADIDVEVGGQEVTPDSQGNFQFSNQSLSGIDLKTSDSDATGQFDVDLTITAQGNGGQSVSKSKQCRVTFDNVVDGPVFETPDPVVMDEDSAPQSLGIKGHAKAGDTLSSVEVISLENAQLSVGNTVFRQGQRFLLNQLNAPDVLIEPDENAYGAQNVTLRFTAVNNDNTRESAYTDVTIPVTVKPKPGAVSHSGNTNIEGVEKEWIEINLNIETAQENEIPEGGILEGLPSDARVQEPDGLGGRSEIFSDSSGDFDVSRGNGTAWVMFENDGDFNFKFVPCSNYGADEAYCEHDAINLSADVKCKLVEDCDALECSEILAKRICECAQNSHNTFPYKKYCVITNNGCKQSEYQAIQACSQRRSRRESGAGGLVGMFNNAMASVFGGYEAVNHQSASNGVTSNHYASAGSQKKASKARHHKGSGSAFGPRGKQNTRGKSSVRIARPAR